MLGALWFGVKALYLVYQNRIRNKYQLLRDIIKEIDWNIKFNTNVGNKIGLKDVKSIAEGIIS